MDEIAAKKGEFTLFSLLMREDAPGTWDLVVSAPWLESGKLEALSDFVKLLMESIGGDSLRHFARIVAIDSSDPRLKLITANFPVDDGELRIRSSDLFGLKIEDAIIFRAKKAA